MSDLLIAAFLLLLPAVLATLLPRRARLAVMLFGLAGALVLVFLVPSGGPDSPVTLFAAIIFLGVAAGAAIAMSASYLRSKFVSGHFNV